MKAKDGTSVDPFTQELVENTLPTVHVIPGKIEAEAYSSMDGISLRTPPTWVEGRTLVI